MYQFSLPLLRLRSGDRNLQNGYSRDYWSLNLILFLYQPDSTPMKEIQSIEGGTLE